MNNDNLMFIIAGIGTGVLLLWTVFEYAI